MGRRASSAETDENSRCCRRRSSPAPPACGVPAAASAGGSRPRSAARQIQRVTFFLDGRKVKTVNAKRGQRVFKLRDQPEQVRQGHPPRDRPRRVQGGVGHEGPHAPPQLAALRPPDRPAALHRLIAPSIGGAPSRGAAVSPHLDSGTHAPPIPPPLACWLAALAAPAAATAAETPPLKPGPNTRPLGNERLSNERRSPAGRTRTCSVRSASIRRRGARRSPGSAGTRRTACPRSTSCSSRDSTRTSRPGS